MTYSRPPRSNASRQRSEAGASDSAPPGPPAPRSWRPSRRLLIRLSPLAALIILLVTGDALNVPLWPLDWWRPLAAVDLQFVPAPEDRPGWDGLVAGQGGPVVHLRTRYGDPLPAYPDRRYLVDHSGRLKLVLTPGTYRIWAAAAGVAGSEVHAFATGPPGTYYTFSVASEDHPNVSVAVAPLREAAEAGLSALHRDAAVAGDLDGLRELAQLAFTQPSDPGTTAVAMPGPLQLQAVEILGALDRLERIRQTLDALPADAYNSRIAGFGALAQAIQGVYGAVGDLPAGPAVVRWQATVLAPESALRAAAEARNQALRGALSSIRRFLAEGDSWKALSLWAAIRTSSELLPLLPEEPPADLAAAEVTATPTPTPTATPEPIPAEPTPGQSATDPREAQRLAPRLAALWDALAATPDRQPVLGSLSGYPEEEIGAAETAVKTAEEGVLDDLRRRLDECRDAYRLGNLPPAEEGMTAIIVFLERYRRLVQVPEDQLEAAVRQARDLDLAHEAGRALDWGDLLGAVGRYRALSERPAWVEERLRDLEARVFIRQ